MLPTVLRSIASRSSSRSPSSSGSVFARARASRAGRALSLGLALASSVAAISLIAGPSTAAPPVSTVLASAAPGGTVPGNGQSSGASISADGRWVAFLSRATNLVPGFDDMNGASGDDAYLLDRTTGTIVLVSGSAGSAVQGANADVYRVQVARNGQYVVFSTAATDVVAAPVVPGPNTNRHVYRFDRLAPAATVMVDVTPAGAPGGGTTDNVTASDDGRYVSFDSTAADLVTGQIDPPGVDGAGNSRVSFDVFLKDLNAPVSTGTTIVSHQAGQPLIALAALNPVNPAMSPDGYGSRAPSLSADGCFVVFYTRADLADLNPAITDSTGLPDVVRLSRCGAGDVFELVSHRGTSTPGAPVSANQWSDDATVSADGNWVVFETHATNVVTGVTDVNGGNEDVYLRDIAGAQTHLISADFADPTRTTDGYSDTASWLGPSGRMVSDDGRYVVFQSRSNTAYPGLADPKVKAGTNPANWPEDVFVRDRGAPGGPTTIPVSVNVAGTALGNGTSFVTSQGSPTISADGQVVVWNSKASDLVAGDTNSAADVFVRGTGVVVPPPTTGPPTTVPPTTTTTTTPPPTSATSTTTTTTAPPPGATTTTGSSPSATVPATTPPVGSGSAGGYWMASDDGQVFGFGPGATLADDGPTLPAGVLYVDLEPRPQGDGYWLLDSTGTVTNRGRAGLLSTRPNLMLGESATSLSATPSGLGYWIFTTRGRVLRFGDAPPLGDLGNVVLNGPVLDSVATPSGLGYYMVGSDGGVFAFGDASFYGSTGGQRLNKPVQSLVPTATNRGYWLVASDGGVFAFGDAVFRGSMGSVSLNRPVTGMVRFGTGYLMVGEDGGIFNFSDLPFYGSLGANPPARPIVAVAPVP